MAKLIANGLGAGGGASRVDAFALASAAGGAEVAVAAGVGGALGAGGADGMAAAEPRADQRQEQGKSDAWIHSAGRRRRPVDNRAMRRLDDVATHIFARRQRLLVGGAQRRGLGVQAVKFDTGYAELLVGRLERSDELSRPLLGGARRLQVALAGRTDSPDLGVDLRLHRQQLRAGRQLARMARPERRQLVSLVARQRRLIGA